ncbi:MAG: radical SAM protein [Rhodospirillales bacterium]|jgi:wyosine [tRNA(Phe)-imidazoG37] synthetase (radical SAM superfamily)|nr:radical SAM protein [Rhodospirillales bacterium]
MRIRNVFGPVPSRRLGRSLGVDLVPTKACSYDCVYCQLGRTTFKTVERREYVPMTDVLMEVEERLATGVSADFITLSGSGEPTLHSDCGDILRTIKTLTHIPVAVLTNSSLLGDPQVREELMAADLVIPSLDAGDAAMFAKINRPHPAVDFSAMVEGLAAFSHAFTGRLWLEIFLLDGLTANEEEARKIATHAARVRADKVQLNTVSRPPAEEVAKAPPHRRLTELASLFGSNAEVICGFSGTMEEHEFLAGRARVLDLLQGGPKTLDDVAHLSGINRNETVKYLEALLNDGLVHSKVRQDIRYFYCESL